MTITDQRPGESPGGPAGAPPTAGDRPAQLAPPAPPETTGRRPDDQLPEARGARLVDPGRVKRIGMAAIGCVAVLLAAEAIVFYGVGALLAQREQRVLIATVRQQIANAASAQDGLYRTVTPTIPPTPGTAVGIMVIPALGLQQAVVEGVSASQTADGPGHVPGTAGLGQPGNSALVGRSAGDGGAFGSLANLRPGDHIVTATVQGESLYVVSSVKIGNAVTHAPVSQVVTGPQSTSGPGKTGTSTTTTTTTPTFNLQKLYGATKDNQMTVVTSGSGTPVNSNKVLVVTAKMRGAPYAPTPQESRSLEQQGTTGEANALPWLLLCLLGLAADVAATGALYRRFALRSAYLLTTAPLLALTIVTAIVASRLFPAWS